MGKIGLSLVLVGILGATSAVAEENGAFVGVQAGYGKMEFKVGGISGKITASGARYGLVAGYKQFFTPAFGVRYYALLDFGQYEDDNGVAEPTYNFNVNADALYNFLSNDALDFGAFAGLSLGYANYYDSEVSGFDLGLNFGLRANIAANHGVELYSRFGLFQQEKDIYYPFEFTAKFKQPYQVGLRYTFLFKGVFWFHFTRGYCFLRYLRFNLCKNSVLEGLNTSQNPHL